MKNNNSKIMVMILSMVFGTCDSYAQTSSSETIKNWGDSLFGYYNSASQGSDLYKNDFLILQTFPNDAYEKLDSNSIAKLFTHFNAITIDTNYYIRQSRFNILYRLYAKANSLKLSQKILEAIFLPQYYEYLGDLNGKLYVDELTPLCKKRISDFLSKKMEDSVTQKIVFNKIKTDQRYYLTTMKLVQPNKYPKTVEESLDSLANLNLKENAMEYKNKVFNNSSSINCISAIIGDKSWRDLSPLLEKIYLKYITEKKGYYSFIQILGVLSRFNYKNYKAIYLNSQIEEFKTRTYSSKDALYGQGQNYFSFFEAIYAESFGCIQFYCQKIYDDSSKFYMGPDRRFLAKGMPQEKYYWSNDYQVIFNEAFHISNSSNWKAFSPQNNSVFNKAGADEIKKWLSKFTQATFPYKKYKGYYKFPKSR